MTTYPPLLDQVAVFGDTDQFRQVTLPRLDASAIDEFLGLAPGTTQYGATPGGHLYAATGVLTGDTLDDVENALMQLQSFSEGMHTYYRPTGDIYPSTYQWIHNCYFTAGDLVTGSVTQIGIRKYAQTFAIVLRQVGVE